MIADALHRNPRLLILAVGVIVVSGLSSFYVMPRMEDPVLGKRVAVISTIFPGADTERVESLVTAKLEQKLRDIAEIKEVQSTSRLGISNIVVELRDDVTDVAPVWSRVRDRMSDAAPVLPSHALSPEFHRVELKAFAVILALKWERRGTANLAIVERLTEDLRLALRGVSGTEKVEVFGDHGEEIVVDISPEVLAAMGLSTGAIAQQIRESDSLQPAGTLRTLDNELLIDVDQQVDTLERLGRTRIQYGREGRTASLADIASIEKGVADSPSGLALVDGQAAVVVGAFIRDDIRIDHWTDRLQSTLAEFQRQLPDGVKLDVILSQSTYVEHRLRKLLWNLVLGTGLVVLTIFVLMGWRSTIVVGTALPLSAFMVLIGIRALKIPIHQMSVTGLIIALGLLIDNAIVIVDEVRSRIWQGMTRTQAIRDGVRHLALPLFGSTLTTTLAFAPIALLPGPPGEFVGAIAVSVILAINASFLLAMTVVPAFTALLQGPTDRRSLFQYGLTSRWLARLYEASLAVVFRVPWLGVALGAVLPLLGYLLARSLPEQFFPPSDRNQIQLEIELAANASLQETRETAVAVRDEVMQRSQVARMHWFLGESAPTFFYNVVPRRRGTNFYGQALVELQPGTDSGAVVRELQSSLNDRFADSRLLVRQLEQGPPFDAPVEMRLRGPDLAVLQRLGSELRLILSQTADVVHTRSDLEETLPKLALRVDEQQARLAGVSHNEIARQLYTTLEGAAAGAMYEGSQEIPIRVRMARGRDLGLEEVASLELQSTLRGGPPRPPNPATEGGTPLSAIAELELSSDVAAIPHIHGERMNEVKAYITSGTLPSRVLAEFEQRKTDSGFQLPTGYSLEYGGETARRDEAVGNLLANAIVLFALMLVTLVMAFRSFRIAGIIAAVGGLSAGLGPGALWCFGFPFGFMAIVGTMGLVGVAINDAIVVMAGIRDDPAARLGDRVAIRTVVMGRTRHVVATTLTTIAGFTPLVLGGGGFWPPLAITIAGGVGGATLLALYLVPSLYLLLMCQRRKTLPPPMELKPQPVDSLETAVIDGI